MQDVLGEGVSLLAEQVHDLLNGIGPEAPVDHLAVLDNRFVRVFSIDMTSVNTHVVVNILEGVKCLSFPIEIIGVFRRIDTSVVELTEKAFVLYVSLAYDIWFSRPWVLKVFVMEPLAGSASVFTLIVLESTSHLLKSFNSLSLWRRLVAATT